MVTPLELLSAICTTSALQYYILTLLHSERPKLHTILAFMSAIGLKCLSIWTDQTEQTVQTHSQKEQSDQGLHCLPFNLNTVLLYYTVLFLKQLLTTLGLA